MNGTNLSKQFGSWNRLKISVIGCGRLGAVHAAALAHLGHEVVGIEVNLSRLEDLQQGIAPFFEPGLSELLRDGMESGRLTFSDVFEEISHCDIHFITVGTPTSQDGVSADLTFVKSAFSQMLPHLKSGQVVVGKSTVPIGTARNLLKELHEAELDIEIAWNPEFLREGFAVVDSIQPDRVVIGTSAPRGSESFAIEQLKLVYQKIIESGTPLIFTTLETAEMVKVAANSFLALKISFINAMAEITETTGADITQLSEALGMDDRIGRKFLNAGVGFGGGCLPKDIRAFSHWAENQGLGDSVALLREVDKINMRRRDKVIQLLEDNFEGNLEGRKVAVLGLAFKPDTDDVRDSPALEIIQKLEARGAVVSAHDPAAVDEARQILGRTFLTESLDECLNSADCIVLLTEWKEYADLNPEFAFKKVATVESESVKPMFLDGRNCVDGDSWKAAGFRYVALGHTSAGLGRSQVEPALAE
jgi:UDPglucose 6-dehydrogenase